MSNPVMLGMPTYVKTMMFLSAILSSGAALANTASGSSKSPFDEMGSKAVGAQWNSISSADKTGNTKQKATEAVQGFIDLLWIGGIALGAVFVITGVVKFITATKNQQPIMPGVVYFVGGLFLMVLGVLSWVFAAQIKSLFIN